MSVQSHFDQPTVNTCAPAVPVGMARTAYRLCHIGGEQIFEEFETARRALLARPGARLFRILLH